jgi:hypothetical protein
MDRVVEQGKECKPTFYWRDRKLFPLYPKSGHPVADDGVTASDRFSL